ncbi:MAG: thioesterase family protein [Bacteroidales bacterium]
MKIKTGVMHQSSTIVTDQYTAKSVGSGDLDVFATPSMIALMENAAMELVNPYLTECQTTVGSEINVKHIKPSPLGDMVRSEATLVEIDGERLVFKLRAWDSKGDIGYGTHVRYIVNKSKFVAKL